MNKNENKKKKIEHGEDDDVENEEDQSGRKKVTVNHLSTLHPPPKNYVGSPSKGS